MAVDADAIATFFTVRYPHAGIVANETDGPAAATLTLPSDVSDLGAILHKLRTELCVLCDARTVSGKLVLECWPARRRSVDKWSVVKVGFWLGMLLLAVGTLCWAAFARRRY